MIQNNAHGQVTLNEKIQILNQFPCFSSFTTIQFKQLAEILTEIAIAHHEIIVKENELVDSIYFIARGEAEVTPLVRKKKKWVSGAPIALLHPGEAIGLNDTGFFSPSGKRSATVKALAPMLLLRLDIQDLYSFLERHGLENSLKNASEQMLRMQFIKQSLPFAKLSPDRLHWLASHVTEEKLPANTIIFSQGEPGDKCYLIRAGEVEITHQNEHGEKKQLALLHAPVLFGEATLITHSPRNATAKTTQVTRVFGLEQSLLSELMENENNVANMFMTLMVDRSRPMQNPHVTRHHRTTADGQNLTILKNPDNSSYFKVSPEGNFIWEKLDGNHTLQEITLELAEMYNVFAPNIVTALIYKLTQSQFVFGIETNSHQKSSSFWQKWLQRFVAALEFKYAFGDADVWLQKLYQNYVRYLFLPPLQIIILIFTILGFVIFAWKTPHILHFFSQNHAHFLVLVTLLPISFLETLLHELGHAFAVKAFGREVHFIGVGFFWFVPVAFTDTSDMWLAPRKQRIVVNLAGIYVDVLIAGLAAILILITPNSYLQSMLWLFALYTYLNGFRMLSPFNEMDGYYVLMDWVEKTNLRKQAIMWLIHDFIKSIKKPALFRKHQPEIIYWIACIIFLIAVSILTLMIQNFVLAALGTKPSNPYLSLILPFLTAIFSSLGVIAEIKRQQLDDEQ